MNELPQMTMATTRPHMGSATPNAFPPNDLQNILAVPRPTAHAALRA
jgi:hypothetical protein